MRRYPHALSASYAIPPVRPPSPESTPAKPGSVLIVFTQDSTTRTTYTPPDGDSKRRANNAEDVCSPSEKQPRNGIDGMQGRLGAT